MSIDGTCNFRQYLAYQIRIIRILNDSSSIIVRKHIKCPAIRLVLRIIIVANANHGNVVQEVGT